MYLRQLLQRYVFLLNIRVCELSPMGIELGNEETYENEYFRESITNELGSDEGKIFPKEKPRKSLNLDLGMV